MAEVTIPEKLAGKEEPSLGAFDQMQSFLNESGELVTHSTPGTDIKVQELQYRKPNVWFLTHFLFPDLPPHSELVKHQVDLIITQRQPTPSDPSPANIEIILQSPSTYPKSPTLKEDTTPIKTAITLLNPASGKDDRVIIRSFDPIGRWLSLSQPEWHKVKDGSDDYYTTGSEIEAEKIVNQLMIPEDMHRVGWKITNEPKISRRGFLALMGVGTKAIVLDSLLSHIPEAPSLSKAFWEQLETATLGVPTEQLKKEIEDRFQILLVSPNTGVNEVEYNNEKKYTTIEWDNPRLKSIIRVLSEIPTHFYLPRNINDKEYKIRFALTGVPIWEFGRSKEGKYQGGFCACRAAETQLVVLDKRRLGQTFLETGRAREVWFHEITHAFTSPEIDKYIDSLARPIGIEDLPQLRKTFASEVRIVSKGDLNPHTIVDFTEEEISAEDWDEGSSGTLGRKKVYGKSFGGEPLISIDYSNPLVRVAPGWYVYRERLEKKGKEYFEEQYSKFPERQKDWEDFGGEVEEKSSLGYGAKNFYEFFSVAAEYYSQGRGNFIKTYERFLGKERAEKLFEGMKRGIFQGKEY